MSHWHRLKVNYSMGDQEDHCTDERLRVLVCQWGTASTFYLWTSLKGDSLGLAWKTTAAEGAGSWICASAPPGLICAFCVRSQAASLVHHHTVDPNANMCQMTVNCGVLRWCQYRTRWQGCLWASKISLPTSRGHVLPHLYPIFSRTSLDLLISGHSLFSVFQ